MGVLGAVLGLAAGASGGFLIALTMTGIDFQTSFDRGVLARGLGIGIPLTLYALGGLSTDQLSRVFIERYISSSTLGVYNIAYLYCTPLSVIFIAINTAWVPKFFGDSLASDHAKTSGLYGTALVIAAVGIAGIMSILSPDVLGLVVSREYQEAQKIVPALMFNAVLSTPVWTVLMNPLILKNRNWSITWCAMASGACNVALNVYLTKRYGVNGAILSSMGALLVLNGLVAVRSLREYHIPYRYLRIAAGIGITAAFYKISLWGELFSPGAAFAVRATMATLCGIAALLLIPGCVTLLTNRGTIG
jgi:O-antigen/teichoic acid export membrane protein